ncbi:MAG TPA: hypothetical protein VGB30_07610 [bacterium]|jgi:Tfp pilus assembly protein PilE
MYREKGFAITELLPGSLIILIISISALPKFVSAENNARDDEVVSNFHRIQIALERHAVDSGGVLPIFF